MDEPRCVLLSAEDTGASFALRGMRKSASWLAAARTWLHRIERAVGKEGEPKMSRVHAHLVLARHHIAIAFQLQTKKKKNKNDK